MINKKIIRLKRFKKNYKRRFSSPKYQAKIKQRLDMFLKDRKNFLLKETKDEIILADIGSHNQLY